MSADAGRPKRVLVVTHTTGFRHSSIATAERVVGSLGTQSGLFETRFCRTADDVRTMLASASLAQVDAVFFANTTGDLGIPDLDAFLAWIRGGGAFLGAHSASDTYHGAPSFIDMLGGEFDHHGAQTEVVMKVENLAHPAAIPLGASWRVFDEIYKLKNNDRARVNVLLSLDRHPDDGLPEAGQPGDLLLAWFKSYGQGRVFYTALGHREDVWESATYQAHLLGAIRWALGP